jgi:hypothetical protein
MNTSLRSYSNIPLKEREGNRVKITELMGENASAAKSALKLVELNSRQVSSADTDEVIEIFNTQDSTEIIKGLCFAVTIVASILSGGESPLPILKAIRESIDAAHEQGNEVETNYKVLNLLDATAENGGSFYLQVYSLQEPFEVILGLTTLFQTLVKTSLGKDVEEVTDYLAHLIDESL